MRTPARRDARPAVPPSVALRLLSVGVGLTCVSLLLAGCGSGGRARAAAPCPTCAATVAQTRADTFAAVAQRIYLQEVSGAPNGAAFSAIARLPGLVRGLSTGNQVLARQALSDQAVVRHAVRARVVRGGRVLVDVGLGFVIDGVGRSLRATDGRTLGVMSVSIQDVIGFLKLVHRLTGTEVVVRGSLDHHAESSLPAALAVTLPRSGPVIVGGRRYVASSFDRPGFAGEQLSIWLLAP